MRGVVPDQIVERFAIRVYLSRLNRFPELRLVAPDCFQFFLERESDVDDERRLLVVFAERECVQNFARAVSRHLWLDLLEAGDEARIARTSCATIG